MSKKYKSQDQIVRDGLKEAYPNGGVPIHWHLCGWLIDNRAIYGIEKASGFGSRPFFLVHIAVFNGARFQRIPKDPFNKMLKDEDEIPRYKERTIPNVNLWIRDRLGV